MQLNEMLKQLCLAPGAGNMTEAGDVAAELLAPFCDRVERDSLGSVIGWRRGGEESQPPLLLEAHIDQIGFVVTGVDEKGFLRVATAGGVDNRVITATEVVVYGDKPYAGVFCSVPPHLGGGDLPAVTEYATHILHLQHKGLFFGTREAYLNSPIGREFLGRDRDV